MIEDTAGHANRIADRLIREKNAAQAEIAELRNHLRCRIEAADRCGAENLRLREALRSIAEHDETRCSDQSWVDCFERVRDIARAALKEGKTNVS